MLERINDPSRGSGYGAAPEERPVAEDDLGESPSGGGDPQFDLDFGASGEDASVIQLVQRVIDEAVERGASDIHFEPQED